MIFSEVYGSYFNAVAEILDKAVKGSLTGKELTKSVQENAFGESIMTIPANLTDGTWPLLKKDYTTVLKHSPAMPLTTLQKQWLKALLEDPRIKLFNPSSEGLEDVEPLFTQDMFVYYDRYGDGDPFEDGEYIENFRTLLTAIKEHRRVRVKFKSGKGNRRSWVCAPRKLEYSPKDDKFRMVFASPIGKAETVNIGRIHSVKLLEEYPPEEATDFEYRMRTLVFELTDERNALERVMLHFANLQKETEKTGRRQYRVTLHYENEDETEILIRLLSFGPVLKVIEPDIIVKQIKERLKRQENLILENEKNANP